MKFLSAALDSFEGNVGRFPTTEEGLVALLERPVSTPAELWQGPYIHSGNLLSDYWREEPYVYQCPGAHLPERFDLYSLGRDGKSLTGGEDLDDVNNWNPDTPWRDYYGANTPRYARWVLRRHALFVVSVMCLAGGLLSSWGSRGARRHPTGV